jgi:acyl-CoA synthetase (AMP-forming)/AMP-acid ligase II
MLGYFDRPEATAESIRDGWFHTGDLGRFDEDGWLYVVDRVKDLILRGGYNVYPAEVEQDLLSHPAVAMTAVVGEPHERLGQEVVAYVVPRNGNRIDVDELSVWAREDAPCQVQVPFRRRVKACPDRKPCGYRVGPHRVVRVFPWRSAHNEVTTSTVIPR